jgi:hypothetical protein
MEIFFHFWRARLRGMLAEKEKRRQPKAAA